MSKAVIYAVGVLMIFSSLLVAQDKEISLRLELDRPKIGLGESATLSVTLTAPNQKQLPEVKLPPLPMFEIYSAGTSTNLQIINGEMSYSQSTNYILMPKREGAFPIRQAWVLIDGKRYESNQLTIEVVGSASQAAGPDATTGKDDEGKARDLFLVAEVDKKNPYVDEQVGLTIKFYQGIKMLSSPDYTPPQTSGFWTGEMAPQKQYHQIINNREYLVVELKTAIFPTKPGKLTIDRAQITATVPDASRRRNRDPFSLFGDFFQSGRNITIRSEPITVNVKPLPQEGKVAEFSGGVGSYKISASVDKREAEVNEAITLTVKISGQGNIKSIPAASLPELPDFRVEESSSDYKTTNLEGVLGGNKTFEYVLIPRLSGLQTIKPITLNYFDPQKQRYLTTSTEEIVLSIKRGELASGPEIPYNMVSGQTINLKETDIRYIKSETGSLKPRGTILLSSPVFLSVAAVPMLLLMGGMIDVRRRRKMEGDVAYARLRRANTMAKKRLRNAERLLTADNFAEYYAEISNVILVYIADKFNVSAHGLTADKVDDLLTQKEIKGDLLERLQEILRQADFGRFAGGADSIESRRKLFEQVREVFVELESVL